MPKPVHDMVNKMLADPDFYPEKSEKQQKAIAWATAWSQYKKKKKKSDNEYSSVRKAELLKLNDEINLLEKNGFIKSAQILDDKFNDLSGSSSDVLTVEAANGGFQIILNGQTPYKTMDTQAPVVFDNLKQAQIYAQKLANTEDFIYKP
jgi:hypothetical protein